MFDLFELVLHIIPNLGIVAISRPSSRLQHSKIEGKWKAMRSEAYSALSDPQNREDPLIDPGFGSSLERSHRNNAATGASAAGARALGLQLMSFYFRAPAKAFFRTRVEYVSLTSFLAAAFSNVVAFVVTWYYLDRLTLGSPSAEYGSTNYE